MNVHDLPAADAVYRWATCRKKRKVGRPQKEERHQAFVKVEKFLEDNDDEKITVSDLVEKMEEYLNDTAKLTERVVKGGTKSQFPA